MSTTFLFSSLLCSKMSNGYLPCHFLKLFPHIYTHTQHTVTHMHVRVQTHTHTVNKRLLWLECYPASITVHIFTGILQKISLMTLGRKRKQGTKAEGSKERSVTFPLADVWEKETLYEITGSKGSKKFPGCQSQSHQKLTFNEKRNC